MQRKGLIKLGDVLWQKTVLHYENDLPSIPAKVVGVPARLISAFLVVYCDMAIISV